MQRSHIGVHQVNIDRVSEIFAMETHLFLSFCFVLCPLLRTQKNRKNNTDNKIQRVEMYTQRNKHKKHQSYCLVPGQ